MPARTRQDLPTFTLDASNAIVKIMVWKSVISDVGLKFETADFGSTGEIKVANTVVNQWEELTFDFSGKIGEPTSTDITGFIVFPDFNDARPVDNVVYFDNITFNAVGEPPPPPPGDNLIDFEGDPASYTFNDFEGGVGSVIDQSEPGRHQPQRPGGPDAEVCWCGLCRQHAGAGCAGGAGGGRLLQDEGALTPQCGGDPEAGAAEPANDSHPHGWQHLAGAVFDFTGMAGDVTGYTLIFDNGTVGDADNNPTDWTFQFDDIDQQTGSCPAPPAPPPEDFEGDPASYTFADFEGGVGSVVANPAPGGINPSAQVGQMQKFAGADFAGSTLAAGSAGGTGGGGLLQDEGVLAARGGGDAEAGAAERGDDGDPYGRQHLAGVVF